MVMVVFLSHQFNYLERFISIEKIIPQVLWFFNEEIIVGCGIHSFQ